MTSLSTFRDENKCPSSDISVLSSGLGRRFRMHPGWICAGKKGREEGSTSFLTLFKWDFENVISPLFPSTLKEVRRVKMLALETEEVHWCALVLMAGFLESLSTYVANQDLFIQLKKSSSGWSLLASSAGVWAVGRKACLVIDQNSLFVMTHLVPIWDMYIHCNVHLRHSLFTYRCVHKYRSLCRLDLGHNCEPLASCGTCWSWTLQLNKYREWNRK